MIEDLRNKLRHLAKNPPFRVAIAFGATVGLIFLGLTPLFLVIMTYYFIIQLQKFIPGYLVGNPPDAWTYWHIVGSLLALLFISYLFYRILKWALKLWFTFPKIIDYIGKLFVYIIIILCVLISSLTISWVFSQSHPIVGTIVVNKDIYYGIGKLETLENLDGESAGIGWKFIQLDFVICNKTGFLELNRSVYFYPYNIEDKDGLKYEIYKKSEYKADWPLACPVRKLITYKMPINSVPAKFNYYISSPNSSMDGTIFLTSQPWWQFWR